MSDADWAAGAATAYLLSGITQRCQPTPTQDAGRRVEASVQGTGDLYALAQDKAVRLLEALSAGDQG